MGIWETLQRLQCLGPISRTGSVVGKMISCRALTSKRHTLHVQRLRGRDVTFVTGTDEHGEKIALSAAKAGLKPKAHCDAVVAEYKDLWRQVGAIPGTRDLSSAAPVVQHI